MCLQKTRDYSVDYKKKSARLTNSKLFIDFQNIDFYVNSDFISQHHYYFLNYCNQSNISE